ncbi:hypothetical protein DBB_36240 [Desulfoluna spongiiphila]|nr:hypothetical protein DBB_36240 [Desulfoluna spongiiphila]
MKLGPAVETTPYVLIGKIEEVVHRLVKEGVTVVYEKEKKSASGAFAFIGGAALGALVSNVLKGGNDGKSDG